MGSQTPGEFGSANKEYDYTSLDQLPFCSLVSQEEYKREKMDLAAGRLCIVLLWVILFTFIGKGFREAGIISA